MIYCSYTGPYGVFNEYVYKHLSLYIKLSYGSNRAVLARLTQLIDVYISLSFKTLYGAHTALL